MKKLNYLLLGAGLFLLPSCSQEDVESIVAPGEGNFNVSIKLPAEFATRALGDGTASTNLNVAVYDATSEDLITTKTATFASGSLETTVSFNFINGKQYILAFFAQSPNSTSVYSFDAAGHQVTVDYDSMTSADNLTDSYDCFYNNVSTGTVGEDTQTLNVTLKRVVAQINLGSNDLSDPDVAAEYGTDGAYIQTTMTATVPNTLDLISGEISGSESITLSNFADPTTADFPISDYDYVAMYYVLATSDEALVDLAFTISNSGNSSVTTPTTKSISVPNAPIQGNFRTNIYGTLLSTSVTYTVTKNNIWGTPSHDINLVWDGTTSTTPDINEQEKTVTLNQPSDLAGLAELVSSSTDPNDFEDYTISLAADFDMGSHEFAGIGVAQRNSSSVSSGSTSFKGVFDGQGHTISNMVITGSANASDAVGFIPSLDGSTAEVKDVTFDNVSISAPNNEQAGIVGMVTNGATVSGVKVTSGKITAKEGVGAIVGRVMLEGTVTGCENSATVTSTGSNTGGIVGAAYYTSTSGTMTISNCTNSGNVSGNSQAIGGVVGLSSANVSGCTNNGTITGATTATGGVVGQQNCYGTISGCTNNGTVIGGNNYGTGGICGWVRYNGTTSAYPLMDVITVSGCTNTASVTGSIGVGGIVGVWYMAGVCENNINTAPSISASNQFVAGIVGTQQWTETGPLGSSVTGNTNLLIVKGNVSTTPMTAITGGASNQYIYVNSPDNVQQEDNTDVLPSTGS